jgi:hypothetical protein
MYKLLREGEPTVIRISDGLVIPPDLNGRHWLEYMDWVYAGNTPAPADPSSPPRRISKATIVERLTNEEADAVEATRFQWTAKQRLTWEAAGEMIDPEDELLVSFLDTAVGQQRRMEILS